MRPSALILALVGMAGAAAYADEPQPSQKATIDARIRAAGEAIEANPQDAEALARRAALYAASGQPEKAIADYDRLLKLDPNRADAYDARGSEHFKLGHVDESIADFDRFLKLRPDQEPWHWKRGISYYYAGRFDEGRKQFEGYQSVDDNDVENAVWRYLCMARDKGVEAARKDMLKIKPDPRPGMMEIYALFRGQGTSDDVLRASAAGSPQGDELNERQFYAHLYLGLYYESLGDGERAKQHLTTAAEKHKIGHYMWNVADVHTKRNREAEAAK